eukprot:COSAG02_NODE_7382_length_3040_cov_2.117647_3_plen_284_part_00
MIWAIAKTRAATTPTIGPTIALADRTIRTIHCTLCRSHSAPTSIHLARARRVAISRWTTASRVTSIRRDAGRDHAVGVRDRGAVQRRQRGAEHLQRAVRQALRDALFGAVLTILAAVVQEAGAFVATRAGVGAGGVLATVVLITVAKVDWWYGLLARIAGPALCALALVRIRVVVAGSTVLAWCRGTVVGWIACPAHSNAQRRSQTGRNQPTLNSADGESTTKRVMVSITHQRRTPRRRSARHRRRTNSGRCAVPSPESARPGWCRDSRSCRTSGPRHLVASP